MRRWTAVVAVVGLALGGSGLVGCDQPPTGQIVTTRPAADRWRHQEPTPEYLQSLLQAMRAAKDAGRDAEALSLAQMLFPTMDRLDKVVRAPTTDGSRRHLGPVLGRIMRQVGDDHYSLLKRVLPTDPKATSLHVVQASVDELKQMPTPPELRRQWPDGLLQAAKFGTLRPGVGFLKVQWVPPGTEPADPLAGHLVYFDGQRWMFVTGLADAGD